MHKTLLVLWQEIITTVTRKSFLFATFGIPLISSLIFSGAAFMSTRASGGASLPSLVGGGAPAGPQREGYVDQSGLIRQLPNGVSPAALVSYPNEAEAQAAVRAGQIAGYYLIPADYLQTGKVYSIRADFSPFEALGSNSLMQWVLRVNLLGGDPKLAQMIEAPMSLQATTHVQTGTVPEAAPRDENNPLTFFLPYTVTMVYYFVIIMSASLLLNSVTKEKENRVIEILMSAVTPRQLLIGKIAGLGLVGLMQVVLWVGTGFTLLRLSGRTFSLPAAFQLPLSFLVWAVVFFLLGYAVYASLMAAVGALVPNLREASQATFVVIMPLLIPLFLVNVLINTPHSPISVGLSLFPLTAPVAMMTRLSAGGVPVWQPALAALLLGLTAVFIVRAVANMFRAQVILSGQPFQLKRFIGTLVGRI